MKCPEQRGICAFCGDDWKTYYADRYGGYCSKVCRLLDLDDSLIKQKQKIRKMLV